MNVKYSSIIPFKGYYAINLYGTLFVRKEYKYEPIPIKTLNHKSIHTAQMKDFCKWLPIGGTVFYIIYFINWIINLILNPRYAYKSIIFEKEAYKNQRNLEYLDTRKRFACFKFK